MCCNEDLNDALDLMLNSGKHVIQNKNIAVEYLNPGGQETLLDNIIMAPG